MLSEFSEIRRKLQGSLSCSLNDFIREATEENSSPKDEFRKLFSKGKFITFNYSHTLEDIYSIEVNRILYIHGKAKSRIVTRDDYEYGTLYNDASLIFGHGDKCVPEDEDAENDIFSPHRILCAISNDLRKKYRTEPFGIFVSDCIPSSVEIIGHSLGNVDLPYFKKLNNVICDTATIIYWLYDESELESKKNVLNRLFQSKRVIIRNYEGEVLY